jgi:hypothetical protein
MQVRLVQEQMVRVPVESARASSGEPSAAE